MVGLVRMLCRVTGRVALVVGFVAVVLTAATSSASAASCGSYNPVCPYQSSEVLGGTDPASLDGPLAVAVTPDGNVVGADAAHESVREFSPTGTLIRQIGTPGSYTELDGVAVDPSSGEIWVASNCEVQGFGPNGTPNVSISGCGSSMTSAPISPAAITVGPNSDLYVLNSRAPTVVEFSPTGTELGSFSVSSAFPSGFEDGTIAVDSSGDVYVEPTYLPIYEFDSSGNQIGMFSNPDESGGDSIAIANGNLYVDFSDQINAYSLSGQAPVLTSADLTGSWSGDFALDSSGVGPTFAVSPNGLDVTTTQHSIEEFGSGGSETGSWGSLAADDYVPSEALADSAGDTFVLDQSNHRVIEYDAAGDPPSVFADLSSYSGPDSAAIDPSGDLVVSVGNELLTYDSAGQVANTLQIPSLSEDLLGFDSSGDSYLYGFGGSFQDSGGISEYSPTGALLDSWPLSANYVALGPNGDIYGSNFFGSDSSISTDIAEFSSTGHLLQVIDSGDDFEPSLPGPIAVDASGRLYEQASDNTIRAFDPSGNLIAVWPDGGSAGLRTENGSVYVAGPGNQVTVYSDFLNPLPAAPTSGEAPENLAMQASLDSLLNLAGPTSATAQSVKAPITCTGSAYCLGTAELATKITERAAHRTRTEILGKATFTITPGHHSVTTIRLNRTALLTLKKRSLLATLTINYSAGTTHRTISRRVTLRRRRA